MSPIQEQPPTLAAHLPRRRPEGHFPRFFGGCWRPILSILSFRCTPAKSCFSLQATALRQWSVHCLATFSTPIHPVDAAIPAGASPDDSGAIDLGTIRMEKCAPSKFRKAGGMIFLADGSERCGVSPPVECDSSRPGKLNRNVPTS